jgi:formiminoglutamase
MPHTSPPDISPPITSARDPRVGHLLGSGLAKRDGPAAVLLGFPSDEGVGRNGGRVGAAEGPRALRAALYRLTPDSREPRLEALLRRTRDLGDLDVTGDLEIDQRNLGQLLAPHLDRGALVIVLGGGHETSYGHFLGYVTARRTVDILNWDAHADVRELKNGSGHSGSPFRQAIEDASGACRRYVVAGVEPHLVSRDHLDYVQQHGGVIWRDGLDRAAIDSIYGSMGSPTMVSFDLDALNQGEAPGVSAPNAAGLTSELWLAAAYAAGRSRSVTSVDVVELNPRVDRDDQTARLAALTVWWLLRGCAERL